MYEKLADVFNAVAVKYLKAVDVPRGKSKTKGSNQHEIGGLVKAGFADYLGRPEKGEVVNFDATMVYMADEEGEPNICNCLVSWYNTRYESPHRGPEYRLYYKENEVTQLLQEDDFFLIALTKENTLYMIFAPQNSEVEQQLKALFAATDVKPANALKKVNFTEKEIIFPVRTLLAQLGIELFKSRQGDEKKLQSILETYGPEFPKTKSFSAYSRSQVAEVVDPVADPDQALITWFDQEEHLFRLLERHLVAVQLKQGFGEQGDDVDAFIKFSLSVQNRRKSRAGHSFENHIAEVLHANQVSFDNNVLTEGKQRPDFLFPGKAAYDNKTFDVAKLKMLGAKTSCKERWRQVLAEAEKIKIKHLITLEPAISEDQTKQMSKMNVKLVVPLPIQQTYTASQLKFIASFKSFIFEVKETQQHLPS
ncbi:type II restriction endonuclease [Marinospirillum insulare]|uniref:Type II restriction endonuclease n=1 Tax=Marinospirillum insulare TaxID=217169 RepID=A0ABQ5ZYL2_9GAMM|nr:type II restriction endonuclease [Marinospirillum insulare]GLR64125.1 type II restriction endonuclease [Marinospirillum insulare]